MVIHFHRRTGAHPKHSTLLVQESWCGEGGTLATDGREVTCEACKRAWEGVARPITTVELAEVVGLLHDTLTTDHPHSRAQLASDVAAYKTKLLAPPRKWPF